MTEPLVTRFAPSPTGHLHIGGARSALFCWAYAKKSGGRFMLRIEDTDAARSSDESARGIMEDLAWLGIEWEDGPKFPYEGRVIAENAREVGGYFQARRVHIYNSEIERLVKAGRAYPAFDTNEETEAQRRAAVAAKQTYRYPRPVDLEFGVHNAALADRWARANAGARHVVRFMAPREEVVVADQVLGDVRIAAGELDDFVIRKADNFPTYHFAVVVDDEGMGVTHVLRAQEHLANTPRHVALQRALKYRTPVYAHMPLIFNADGTKMSKRDKAKAARAELKKRMEAGVVTLGALGAAIGMGEPELAAFVNKESDAAETAERIGRHLGVPIPEVEVADFRESGYLPEAICNFVALLGWNPGLKTADGKDLEKFDNQFLAEHFSLDRIGRTNSKFDRAKLLSFNADALGALPDEAFRARFEHWLSVDRHRDEGMKWRIEGGLGVIRDRDRGLWLARAIKPRAKTFAHALDACKGWLLRSDESGDFDGGAVQKHLHEHAAQGIGLLELFRGRLEGCEPFDPPTIHAVLDAFVKEKGLPNPGPIAQAVRVAVAGVPVTPGIPETLSVLGKASVLARIDKCLLLYGSGG